MDYSLSTVIAAFAPAVPLSDAKDHLVVDHLDDDFLITRLVADATAWVEGRTGRRVAKTTLKAEFSAFSSVICLPSGPVKEIVSIAYLDADNAEQTLAADQYELDAPNRMVRPAYNITWPNTASHWNAVRVTYGVGYYDPVGSGDIDLLPGDLRAAILLVAGDLYENREGQQDIQLYTNATAEMLVNPYRILAL